MKRDPLLAEALSLYCFEQPQAELIRHNENMTYKITDADQNYVLRIHKRVEGFSADIYSGHYDNVELLRSELDIISALKKGTSIPMQTPLCDRSGSYVNTLKDGSPVSLLKWVEGQTVEDSGITAEISRESGKMMAQMHSFFAKQYKTADIGHTRYDYDQTILPNIADKIESALQDGAVTKTQAQTIIQSLDEMRIRFDELDDIHEKHLVHADLGTSNVVIGADGQLTPIDFSLCGYSHFYMDIAGVFGLSHDDENRRHIIEGYESTRKCEVNPRYVEPYLALSVVLFIACQYERAKNWACFPGHMERWCSDIFQPLAEKRPFVT